MWSAGFAGVWHLSGITESTGIDATTESGAIDSLDTAAKIADGRTFNSAMLSAGNASQVTDVFATGGAAEALGVRDRWRRRRVRPHLRQGAVVHGAVDVRDERDEFAAVRAHVHRLARRLVLGREFTTGEHVDARRGHVRRSLREQRTREIYINGSAVLIGVTTNPSGTAYTDGGGTLTIGDRTITGRAFAGTLDELRLVRTMRAAGWIATEYANQADPAGFLHVN